MPPPSASSEGGSGEDPPGGTSGIHGEFIRRRSFPSLRRVIPGKYAVCLWMQWGPRYVGSWMMTTTKAAADPPPCLVIVPHFLGRVKFCRDLWPSRHARRFCLPISARPGRPSLRMGYSRRTAPERRGGGEVAGIGWWARVFLSAARLGRHSGTLPISEGAGVPRLAGATGRRLGGRPPRRPPAIFGAIRRPAYATPWPWFEGWHQQLPPMHFSLQRHCGTSWIWWFCFFSTAAVFISQARVSSVTSLATPITAISM